MKQSKQTLSNKRLTIQIDSMGAELSSIVNNETGQEYLWQADPAFWKRHSPVLFPIVGSLWNGEYRHEGKVYKMSQHGFARDCRFSLEQETSSAVSYLLRYDEETLAAYPFPFELRIAYKLEENKVAVIWKVKNVGESPMYFQIGAHPAFYYPDFNPADAERGYFAFDKPAGLSYNLIKEKGCVEAGIEYPLPLEEDGLLPVTSHTFDKDALILENSQVKKVTLLDKQKRPYLAMSFDAPLVGLWSQKGDCPFVCIEPWYGRCDRVDYTGELKDRDWINRLDAGAEFQTAYIIELF
ncbi:aldose 1-epimerase family protein [Dysgonomonas sp. 25]|uniref:aldose 1-epimerase family protein n=1 Tax=Dysgonomonas sp. 25 TaxID=2302933 RepID=UPI0013D8052B|nr:aldose 1-epimerase family protein [Dysgonomonas sp. 25]NDV70415.1 aldose 1-epimerase family protein [Dysgonomonas sp. 25]